MTFDRSAGELAAVYGFTTRQARFLTLVALMSGYCLRRQYTAYAGVAYGKNPRVFLDELVLRRLATRHRPRPDRGYLYHLKSRAFYETLGLENNRHRRPVTAARQARRLMLLDFAIAQRQATWYATEPAKTALFTDEFGLAPRLLPERTYTGADGATTTTRHFVQKLPIYRLPDDPTIYFVTLALETTGQTISSFLSDHAPLLRALPAWRLVVVFPRMFRAGERAWRAAFDRAHFSEPPTLAPDDACQLHTYFRVHHALTEGGSTPITIDQAHELRRRRFGATRFEAMYPFWCAVGGPRLSPQTPPDFAAWRPPGGISTYELPYSYDLFGSLPGVA